VKEEAVEEAGLPLVRPLWLSYGLAPRLATQPAEAEAEAETEAEAEVGVAGGDAALVC
jgi:hypothetical protein